MFSNNFREFLLKFTNNQLGLNTRTSHFGGMSRGCTFCSLNALDTVPDETFFHLFFLCPSTRTVQDEIENTVLKISQDDNLNKKKLRWFGLCETEPTNNFSLVVYLYIQYLIWTSKLRVALPDPDFIVGETIFALEKICKINVQFLFDKNNYICPLTRYWDVLLHRGDG